MNILFLSRWFPYPPNNGSKIRVFNLIRGLAEDHDITLLSFLEDPEINQNGKEISAYCSNTYTIPWRTYNPTSARARFGYLNPTPRSLKDTFSQGMAQKISQLVSSEKFDCVIASQTDAARYQRFFHVIPAIFEEVEIGVLYNEFLQASDIKNRLRNGLTWTKYRRYIVSLIRSFDACTVVSDNEKSILHDILPDYQDVSVIPNCLNLSDYDIPDTQVDPTTIIFTGSFRYFANYNAMIWFVENVLPRIKIQLPLVKLTITGDHANMPLPSNDCVTLSGFVDDVRPLIARSWISIAPIFQGGGTRLKILEAMALRTPVVATSKGAEGLDVVNGYNILIADTVDDFAEAVIRLCTDVSLRHEIAENAYQLVRKKYDWSKVIPMFNDLIQNTVSQQGVA